MYWMLTEKSKGANQGTDYAKILASKAQTAVNRALRLLALEGNLEEGLLEHTVANSCAKRKIRVDMSHEVIWKPTKNQTQGGESKEDRATMEDGMPKLTKTEQLQIMQDKSDVIIKLQRELQKEIQDYKLTNLQYLLTEPNQAIPKHNKGAKRQVKDVVLWERVPLGPGVPHTMVTKKSKYRHWCPHHHKWTHHTPKECEIQPVPDEYHKVAPNGEKGENF